MDPEDDLPEDDFDLDEDQDEIEDPEEQDDPDEGQDDRDQDEPPQQRSRGESRQARLARENREVRERSERLERELADLKGRIERPQTGPQETPEQFNARLAQMDPVDRLAYLQQLSTQNTQQQIQALQFQLQDTSDKTQFDSFCANNKQARALSSDVETRLAEYRKQGINVSRMDVLKHVLGEKALANLDRSTNRARRAADERQSQQRARPVGSRSDAAPEGRRSSNDKAARDRRVEGYKL